MKLDLSHNRISGMHLSLLSHYLGGLEALSLQNNNIRTYKDLDIIVGRAGKEQMLRLQELMLSGNPLQVSEYEKGRAEFYKRCENFSYPGFWFLKAVAARSPDASPQLHYLIRSPLFE